MNKVFIYTEWQVRDGREERGKKGEGSTIVHLPHKVSKPHQKLVGKTSRKKKTAFKTKKTDCCAICGLFRSWNMVWRESVSDHG